MKLTAVGFFIAGFAFCNAVYIAFSQNWWLALLNLFMAGVNFYWGWKGLKHTLYIENLRGQLKHHERIKESLQVTYKP